MKPYRLTRYIESIERRVKVYHFILTGFSTKLVLDEVFGNLDQKFQLIIAFRAPIVSCPRRCCSVFKYIYSCPKFEFELGTKKNLKKFET